MIGMPRHVVVSRGSSVRERRVVDPSHLPLGPGCDLRLRRQALDQAVQVCSRLAGERVAVAARSYCGEVGGFQARRAMPDAVNAAVHADESPAGEPMLDLVCGEPGGKGLRPGHHPM